MGLCAVSEVGTVRHLDIFTCPNDSWGTFLLHATGSDLHNRSMRHWTQQLDLALSEKALAPCVRNGPAYTADGQYQNNKQAVGAPLPIKCERDVYDALGLVWTEPRERTGKVRHKPLQEWDPAFTMLWLKLVGMEEFTSAAKEAFLDEFEAGEPPIDGARLAAMDAAELKREFGMTLPVQVSSFLRAVDVERNDGMGGGGRGGGGEVKRRAWYKAYRKRLGL
jgi:hypothetical protein